jgi:tRNA(adenine34) deaminase
LKQDHEIWMRHALAQAEKAYEAGEVPIGAVVVSENRIIGRGYNQREGLNDPTAHAEIIAITAAANTLGDWRLSDCLLYVTKEPCPMCAGAIVNARLKQVVFGCYDEQEGCCGSLYQLCGDPRFKTQAAVKGGVIEAECQSIIKQFFQNKRKINL